MIQALYTLTFWTDPDRVDVNSTRTAPPAHSLKEARKRARSYLTGGAGRVVKCYRVGRDGTLYFAFAERS